MCAIELVEHRGTRACSGWGRDLARLEQDLRGGVLCFVDNPIILPSPFAIAKSDRVTWSRRSPQPSVHSLRAAPRRKKRSA
jgi:hypothetical protein